MSDLTTYRQMTEVEDEAHRYPACPHVEDHRLQDIADTWAKYLVWESKARVDDRNLDEPPPIFDLLDALGGTDNETA